MFRPLAAVLMIVTPALASAQQAETGRAPDRVRSVMLSPGEKCPPSSATEVVVCGTINPDEQYRLPKELRRAAEVPAQNQSWVNKVERADQIGRVAGGLPNTCSPVGTGGQSGCAIVNGRAWAAERRAAERNDALVPGGEQ